MRQGLLYIQVYGEGSFARKSLHYLVYGEGRSEDMSVLPSPSRCWGWWQLSVRPALAKCILHIGTQYLINSKLIIINSIPHRFCMEPSTTTYVVWNGAAFSYPLERMQSSYSSWLRIQGFFLATAVFFVLETGRRQAPAAADWYTYYNQLDQGKSRCDVAGIYHCG